MPFVDGVVPLGPLRNELTLEGEMPLICSTIGCGGHAEYVTIKIAVKVSTQACPKSSTITQCEPEIVYEQDMCDRCKRALLEKLRALETLIISTERG